MPGITGQGTTFNLPNYTGELFALGRQTTPFLSAIGGLTGGKEVGSTIFTWQSYDLRDPSKTRQRKEGADAPTAEQRVRNGHKNVVEIHQEAVDISYTKQAATAQVASSGSVHPNAGSSSGTNPVTNEKEWQVDKQIKQIARDVELSFVDGDYQESDDNGEPRRTRGLTSAIETNKVDAEGAELSRDLVLGAMQLAYDNGGISEDETRTLMLGTSQKLRLTSAFVPDGTYRQESRTVGGVNVQTIETDFGTLNVMLNPIVPDDTVLILSLEECAPVFLRVPEKGHFFVEPLAKTGASDKAQIYGEIGLEYGSELKHAQLTGLDPTSPVAVGAGS